MIFSVDSRELRLTGHLKTSRIIGAAGKGFVRRTVTVANNGKCKFMFRATKRIPAVRVTFRLTKGGSRMYFVKAPRIGLRFAPTV